MIFQNFKTIRSFRRDIYSKIYTLNDALEEEINLKDEIDKFKESTKLENQEKKEKNWLLKTQLDFLTEDKKFWIALNKKYFRKVKQKENKFLET